MGFFSRQGRTLLVAAVAVAVGTAEAQKGSFTDERDGKVYRTEKIGKQTWMAENLNYRTEKRSCCYENNPDSCKKYGRLYDWNTAKAACPKGWHLPSDDEWEKLIVVNESEGSVNAVVLPNALPGGRRNSDGSFDFAGINGEFWSATEIAASNEFGWGRSPSGPSSLLCVGYSDGCYFDAIVAARHINEDKNVGYSVRCVAGVADGQTRPSELVGIWMHCEKNEKGEYENMELRADGTGLFANAGITWKAENNRLVLLSPSGRNTSLDYKVSGYELALVLHKGDDPLTLVRKENFEEYKKKNAINATDSKNKQGPSSLVGIWVPEGGGSAPRGFPDKMELLSDGTCIFEGISASWKISGERLFFMNIGGMGGEAYNYKMSNSALVLINDHGQRAQYRKHRSSDKPLPTKEQQEMANLMNIGNAAIQQRDKQGMMYYEKGQYDKAIEVFNELIDVMPKSTRHYLFRGLAYQQKKNYDRAITDFTTALKLEDPNDPKNERIYNVRGYSYLEKRDYDKALADFNKAVQLAPNKANPYDSRGEAYFIMGDYDKAIADYSKALRLDPDMVSAKKGLVEARLKKNGR